MFLATGVPQCLCDIAVQLWGFYLYCVIIYTYILYMSSQASAGPGPAWGLFITSIYFFCLSQFRGDPSETAGLEPLQETHWMNNSLAVFKNTKKWCIVANVNLSDDPRLFCRENKETTCILLGLCSVQAYIQTPMQSAAESLRQMDDKHFLQVHCQFMQLKTQTIQTHCCRCRLRV